jgi:hypothetical protein
MLSPDNVGTKHPILTVLIAVGFFIRQLADEE